MKYQIYAAFLFPVILLSLPKASAGDVNEGKNVFLTKGLGCHAFTCNKQGPNLGGLFGRKMADVKEYGFYSQELKISNIEWNGKSLDAFFSDPGKMFPESVMADFGKIEDAEQRRNLIAFLKTEDPTVNLCPQG